MIIAVDFDGTIVKHTYPEIGEDIGAVQWLRRFKRMGAMLLLYTMRDGAALEAAVDWCKKRGIEFDCVNTNPTQWKWTMSPKCYAHVYIDDAAFGTPMIECPDGGRPWVNWSIVGPAIVTAIRQNTRPLVKSVSRYA